MVDKTKTVVKIAGKEYTMRGFESEEYIHKVAIYVDKKMEEIKKCQPNLSTSMISVLTAINIADEVIKQKEEIEKLEKKINDLKQFSKQHDHPKIYDVSKKVRK